jgi:hypothetical protein
MRKRTEAEIIHSQLIHQMNLIDLMLALYLMSGVHGFIPLLHFTRCDSNHLMLLSFDSKKNDSVNSVNPLSSISESNPKSQSVDKLHNPILDHAITNANLMSKTFGISSKEARLAWERVQDIAASDMPDAMKDAIDQGDEFLLKILQAHYALDDLNSNKL